jgi:hypothetical protein
MSAQWQCEAPRCTRQAEARWREPGTGVTWAACRKHLERWITTEVLKEERTELACDVDEHGWPTVYVVRSSSAAAPVPA